MGDDGRNDSGLEALAARGRAAREARHEAERRKRGKEAEAQQRRGYRALRHTLFASSGAAVGLATLSLLVVMAMPFGVGFYANRELGVSEENATYLGALALAVGIGLGVLVYRALARAAERSERAWIASLPFDVHGYFEVLTVEPSSSADLVVAITFVAEKPDPNQLADAAAALSFVPDEKRGKAVVFRRDDIDCSQNDGPDTNSPLLAAMRHVIDDLLVPMHVSHRVEKVKFERD